MFAPLTKCAVHGDQELSVEMDLEDGTVYAKPCPRCLLDAIVRTRREVRKNIIKSVNKSVGIYD